MAHKVIVTAASGQPDNLKESVKVAFTLTPADTETATRSYDPLARWVTDFFPGGGQSASLEWDGGTIFGDYTAGSDGRCYYGSGPKSPVVPPGYSVTATTYWNGAVPYGAPDTVTYFNRNGITANLLLTKAAGWAIVAYHPVVHGGSVTVPVELKLQAYIVGNAVVEFTILKAGDLTRPLFKTPVSCNDLPTSSSWKLCQEADGVIRLRNDQNPELGYGPAPKPKTDTALEKSLGERILERLDMMEKSISRIQDDVSLGQKAVAGIQDQLSASDKSAALTRDDVAAIQRTFVTTSDRLSGFGHSMVAVEAKTADLSVSFSQSQDRISEVQRAVSDTQRLVSSMERSVNVTEVQSPNDEAAGINRHTAKAEGKTEQLEKSTQEQLSSVRKALRTMDRRIPLLESRADKLETSSDQTREELSAIQKSLITLDRRLTALEARTAKGSSELDEEVEAGGWNSTSSVGGSPITFPTHLA